MNVIFYSAHEESPASGYWDQALISDILSDPVFKNNVDNEGAIVVIPGAYQTDIVGINQFLSQYKWVILIITSDEESKFRIEEIDHPNITIWLQYPKKGRHDRFFKFPLGYTTETRQNLSLQKKDIDVFYSGQKTHRRREQLSKALASIVENHGEIHTEYLDTEGFSQGISQNRYIKYLCQAKIAPAPSGAVSQDSFRLYEALEAGAIPIADDVSPQGDSEFWIDMFQPVLFPVIKDYDSLLGYVEDNLNGWQERANEIQSWWIRKKQDLKFTILEQYYALTGKKVSYPISVVIPVSFIPSHPNIDVLEQTIKSIRFHLPDSVIYLTFDGLRKEHLQYKERYQEFIRRALFASNKEWGAVYPIIFPYHAHQIGMMRGVLPLIRSEELLYVEQDTPLVTDEPIEWDFLQEQIANGRANMIRLHFEANIPEPHKSLMLGSPENKLLKTVQWSQRPHLASVAFYKRLVSQYFSKDAKCFLEDVLHGKLAQEYKENGVQGWNQWRVFIYFPNDKNIKRSLHTDGRQGAKKYDDTQTW